MDLFMYKIRQSNSHLSIAEAWKNVTQHERTLLLDHCARIKKLQKEQIQKGWIAQNQGRAFRIKLYHSFFLYLRIILLLKMKRSSRRLPRSNDEIEMMKLRKRAKEEDTTVNLLTDSSDTDSTTPCQLSTFQIILNFLTCRWFQNKETLKDELVGFFELIMECFWCSQGTKKVD
ncbi:unnamed protein product [Caenorhabditis nigoni]